MVIFDLLYIDNNGKNLYIEAHVDDAECFKNQTIEGIYINTDETFLNSGVNLESKALVYEWHPEGEPRSIKLKIDAADTNLKVLGFNKNMFFIYIKTNGIPAPDTPCGMDNEYNLGVVYNLHSIYNKAINYTKELVDKCRISKCFIDFILNFKMLEYSIKTSNLMVSIDVWNRLTKNNNTTKIKSKCNCHG